MPARNSFKAQEIDKFRCSTGRSSVTGGELGGKIHELFWNELLWRMNTEVQLLKEVQKIDI